MDRLLSMEVFVAVVELGSLTAAAALHEMSPAMAAKHLKNLETRLGLRLMVRTTRRQSLTEAGQAYFARCKGILAEIRDAEQGAEAMREAPRGNLRITSTVSFGSFAPDAGHRRLPVHLSGRERGTVAERSGGRPGRLALRPGRAHRRAGGFRADRAWAGPLSDDGLRGAFVSGALRHAGHACRSGPASMPGFSYWSRRTGWRLGNGDGGETGYPSGRFVSNNGQALRQAALAGFGIVLQPELLLADDVRAGRLTPILRPYWPAARPISLLYPKDRQALPSSPLS